VPAAPKLAEIQTLFRNAVIEGGTEGIAMWLVGGRDPEQRLAIHRRNYHTSLVDALLTKFPATAWLVGTSFLAEAAAHFVSKHPPQVPCIAEYGAGFPEFLSQCPGAERLPYLRDFAKLEWYVGLVSIAVDNASPGLHYLHASWPVDELMKFYLTDTAPDRFELLPADIWIQVRGARGEFQLNRVEPKEITRDHF
jgi:hypothetical protein